MSYINAKSNEHFSLQTADDDMKEPGVNTLFESQKLKLLAGFEPHTFVGTTRRPDH